MYSEYKIYGPYLCKDGRLRIVLVSEGVKTSMSYPKYLMELFLGRKLRSNEDVHHKDGNPLNNELDNLEILDHKVHCAEHSTKYQTEIIAKCVFCGNNFVMNNVRQRRRIADSKRNKFGPFCSKSCSGKYGTSIQYGSIE